MENPYNLEEGVTYKPYAIYERESMALEERVGRPLTVTEEDELKGKVYAVVDAHNQATWQREYHQVTAGSKRHMALAILLELDPRVQPDTPEDDATPTRFNAVAAEIGDSLIARGLGRIVAVNIERGTNLRIGAAALHPDAECDVITKTGVPLRVVGSKKKRHQSLLRTS